MDKGVFANSPANWTRINNAFHPDTKAKLEETITFLPDMLTMEPEKMAEELKDVTVAFSTWGMPPLSSEQIKTYLPKLEAVFYAAGTVQAFARPFLENGIKVFSAAAANAVPVAEYTLSQILLAGKGYFQSTKRCSTDRKSAYAHSASFPGNMNCKVGIIGAGAIGKLVIQLLKPFQLEVLVFDPFLPDEKAKELGVEKVDLKTIFSECQTISNHLANNEQTKGMLNYELFSLMKPNATFINTGRGAQVVEADLCRAMMEYPERTALLDVTWPEPPDPDSPLLTLENIFLTPHIAGSMSQEVGRMGQYMLAAYEDFRAGKTSPYEVTMEMLATMA